MDQLYVPPRQVETFQPFYAAAKSAYGKNGYEVGSNDKGRIVRDLSLLLL